MPHAQKPTNSLGWLLPKALGHLSPDKIQLFFDLYQLTRRWWPQRPLGMYEILDYETTLELMDPEGNLAIFNKHQRVKFLQDNIIAFQDYVWGDGEVFGTYRCTPGIVADRYKEDDTWLVLISLREAKNAGDITPFRIERQARSGFTQKHEWFQTELRHKTRRLKKSIIFPKKRLCKRAVLVERGRHRTTPLGPEHFSTLPDGRQILTWETGKIRQFEIYTIKWTW